MPFTHGAGPKATGTKGFGVCCWVGKGRGMGALSLGTFQVVNGAQLLAVFFPPVAGVSWWAGGGWGSPPGWWEKSILGLGIRLEQDLEGGYGHRLPPIVHGSVAGPGRSATSPWTWACCCPDGDGGVPSSRGPRPPPTELCRGRCTAAFAREGRVKNPNDQKKKSLKSTAL